MQNVLKLLGWSWTMINENVIFIWFQFVECLESLEEYTDMAA